MEGYLTLLSLETLYGNPGYIVRAMLMLVIHLATQNGTSFVGEVMMAILCHSVRKVSMCKMYGGHLYDQAV